MISAQQWRRRWRRRLQRQNGQQIIFHWMFLAPPFVQTTPALQEFHTHKRLFVAFPNTYVTQGHKLLLKALTGCMFFAKYTYNSQNFSKCLLGMTIFTQMQISRCNISRMSRPSPVATTSTILSYKAHNVCLSAPSSVWQTRCKLQKQQTQRQHMAKYRQSAGPVW